MTAKIISFTRNQKETKPIEPVHLTPVPIEPKTEPEAESWFDDKRSAEFLEALAVLIQEYETDTGRKVSSNLVVHSEDYENYITYAYCRDADQEDAETPGEYYEIAMMVPGLDMLDVISPYPAPDDDDEFDQIWQDNQGEEEDGTRYNVWGGSIDYGLE